MPNKKDIVEDEVIDWTDSDLDWMKDDYLDDDYTADTIACDWCKGLFEQYEAEYEGGLTFCSTHCANMWRNNNKIHQYRGNVDREADD